MYVYIDALQKTKRNKNSRPSVEHLLKKQALMCFVMSKLECIYFVLLKKINGNYLFFTRIFYFNF